MMNEQDKKQIKETVINKIRELEEDLKSLEEAAKPVAPDNAYGRLSRMDAINNKAIVEAALDDKLITLQHYENVLSKIDSDKYGKCMKCGNDIPLQRLMIIPYAGFCMSCTAKRR